MEEEFFDQGDVIIRQGEVGDNFYIVEEGTVGVQKYDTKEEDGHKLAGTKLLETAELGPGKLEIVDVCVCARARARDNPATCL